MSDAARKAAEKKVLPREKFLRYLHVVADAEASEDAPTFEEITLAEHDAALRALLAERPATPAHDPKPNCPDCYGLGLYLYGGTEAPRVCGCRPTEPAPALPDEVREAAERVRKHFHVFPPSPDEILTPFGEDVADLLSALSHSATVAGAPTSWPERHGSGLRAACGTPENWPQCVAGDWIETMVQTAGWVCGKCGHQPGHPCHNGAEKPRGYAPPAAPAPDAAPAKEGNDG